MQNVYLFLKNDFSIVSKKFSFYFLSRITVKEKRRKLINILNEMNGSKSNFSPIKFRFFYYFGSS